MVRRDLQAQVTALGATIQTMNSQRRTRLDRLTDRLQALSPVAILDRGYALVFDASGTLLKDATRVHPGDEIRARLAKGEVDAVAKRSRK
jgi:exodeoxyribonuclease VII large subunit